MEVFKSLADDFFALSPDRRRSVQFTLCQHALEKWHVFTKTYDRIEFVETVVGTRQLVDKLLPFDALASARQGSDSGSVAKRYLELVTAMQDDDLSFPENINFAYYAIYNLFNKYAQEQAVDDWLIVNQALSSELDRAAWDVLLSAAIYRAKLEPES